MCHLAQGDCGIGICMEGVSGSNIWSSIVCRNRMVSDAIGGGRVTFSRGGFDGV